MGAERSENGRNRPGLHETSSWYAVGYSLDLVSVRHTVAPAPDVTPVRWPPSDMGQVVHISGERGIDEFGSEDLRTKRTPIGARWYDGRFPEGWMLPALTLVAAVEAVVIIGVGIHLSGVLQAATGTLVVESQPPGAEVLVDGTRLGTTPTRLEVPEGNRSVQFRLAGQTRGMAIEIARGETSRARVDIVSPPTETPRTGSARITSDPAGARVEIDGAPAGMTPVSASQLAPGPHALTLRGTAQPVSRTFEVRAGETTTFHVELPRPGAGPGRLELPATPPLQVFEDGRWIGGTATGPIAFPAGAHHLQFVNEDLGIRVAQQVIVRPGATVRATPALPRGSLAINADPWADVWLNGEPVGQTPLSGVSRPVGFYDVLLRHPTLGDRSTQVKVTATAPVRLNIGMRPPAP
jgi:hypothetical protein